MSEPLIVYHSQSGASASLALAAERGVRAAGGRSRRLRACDAGFSELAEAGGLLLVCAENSGRLAGGAKDFLDRLFYPAHERGLVLPYALLVSAGNDGRGAVAEAQRILRGIPFSEAIEPRIIRGLPGEADLVDAQELGAAFATGLEMGIF
jgi:hypothetical protein